MKNSGYRIAMLSLVLLLFFSFEEIQAQLPGPSPRVPRCIDYQGLLTRPDGTRYNGTFQVKFELIDLDNPASVLFQETVTALNVQDGIFQHAIGSVDTVGNRLNPLIFQKRVGLRLTVGTELLQPPIPIYPTPVAMVALYADSLKAPLLPGPQGPPGPPGPPGPAGVPDTIKKVHIDTLIVLKKSEHFAWEHFGPGISIGGTDSAQPKLVIDSTGEVYGKSFHIVTGNPSNPTGRTPLVSFDSTKSVHKVKEFYITGTDTTVIDGTGITAPEFWAYRPGTSRQSPRTIVDHIGVLSPEIVIYNPQTDSITAVIDSSGEAYFRSLHIFTADGSITTVYNPDGTSEHFGLETFRKGVVVPLGNGNFLRLDPAEGFTIKTPTGQFIAHINPSGQTFFVGPKSAIVETPSYGARRLYAEEAPEIWFTDRGSGQLVGGEAVISIDPMFLESVTINDSHPMIVKITPTGDCNGIFVAVKGEDRFVVRELMKGLSNATFDWEVAAKRRGYEDVRMELHTPVASISEERPESSMQQVPPRTRRRIPTTEAR